jgi:hypothetical protein
VAAPAHGRQEIVLAGEADRGAHVVGAGAARDQRGSAVDDAIPHLASGIVFRVARVEQVARKRAWRASLAAVTGH